MRARPLWPLTAALAPMRVRPPWPPIAGLAPMRVRPPWPPIAVLAPMRVRPPWPLIALLALGVTAAGCGKSLPSAGEGAANAKVITPVSPQGAGALATKNTTRLGGADAATDAAAVALAVYPGLTAASRPQAVVVADEGEWLAA